MPTEPFMASPLKLLVIGSGSIGRRHHQNLLTLGVNADLISYQANSAEQIESMLDDKAVSGVVIATATHIRLKLILACAQRDLPVYIEKPLAFLRTDLDQIYRHTENIANRSVVGFMMRYHPLFCRVAEMDLSRVYRYTLTIGHDVTQWRQNWKFADSYAALPEGGGVLLDLCHELDMAACLFPQCRDLSVRSVGHHDYPGVDFSTEIMMTGDSVAVGRVSMDYLSPVSTRSSEFFSVDELLKIDFNTLQFSVDDGQSVNSDTLIFERNDMFLSAMADFLALIEGREVSTVKHMPRLDLVRENCELIADAWQHRIFTGKLSGPVE